MDIYKKIPLIMGEVGAVKKTEMVQSGPARFNFRSIDQVYNALNQLMSKHGVFSTSKILSKDVKPIISKNGGAGTHATVDYEFTFFAADGSSVKTEVTGEAIDYGDKAHNKCEAIAHKYALTQLFIVPYDDMEDPDRATHDLKPLPARQNAPAAASKNKASGKDYVVKFGDYRGKKLAEVDNDSLRRYAAYVEEVAMEKGIELTGEALELVLEIEKHVGGGA